jgi:hypothetical protein
LPWCISEKAWCISHFRGAFFNKAWCNARNRGAFLENRGAFLVFVVQKGVRGAL